MPRYTGKYKPYKRRGRRSYGRRDNSAVLRALLIIIPILAAGCLLAGGFWAYRDYTEKNPEETYPVSSSPEQLYTQEQNDLLVGVVNTANPLAADYIPELASIDGVEVNAVIEEQYLSMFLAAQSDGVSLKITEGYVSFARQDSLNKAEEERLKKENGYTAVRAEAEAKKTVPPGGCSEFQTGLLIRLASDEEADKADFSQTKAYSWLIRNAGSYGFVMRYPTEKQEETGVNGDSSLFRFVGEENAKKMRVLGMSLDEYNAYLAKK